MRKKRKTRLKEAIFRDQLSSRMRAGIRGMDVPSEHRMGILTLVLLVLLISIVILAETFVIPRSSDATSFAPAYSFEVHRSVLALIVSIVLSILCIQWLLRYTDRSHPRPVSLLKMLSIGWMILNLALVTIAFLKNIDYVRHLGLSYLRLGVFFYLAAASIGIIYTMKRILNDHNLWYLVSRNAFAALTLMVMAACVPWDMVITRFNIHTAITENKALDMYYIRSLRHYDRVALHEYDMRNQKSVSHDIITWDANGNYYFIDTYHREYILSGTLNEFINVYKANHYDKNR